ncbi:MAG TPA: fluoride efflux transporter CrcB [Skermanella sp.]|nr:fluoride efflux transporter CrcB [Skermanella sp.]
MPEARKAGFSASAPPGECSIEPPGDHRIEHGALPSVIHPATVPFLDPWTSSAVMNFSPAMLLAVAAGGAAGSVARFVAMSVIGQWFGTAFPYGTLAVNVIGSLVMGVLVEWWALAWSPAPELRALLAVGVLGGFTTFSTFSLDLAVLMQRGEMAAAALYMVVSVIFSVGALFAGLFLVRGIVG